MISHPYCLILAENQTQNIVLVGNNADAHEMQNVLQEKSIVKKNVIFGFQLNAGLREALSAYAEADK